MILETERLILRRYTADDLNDLYEYLSDDEVVRFEPYRAMSLEETRDNLKWRIETDEMGKTIWKDTYIYAKLGSD